MKRGEGTLQNAIVVDLIEVAIKDMRLTDVPSAYVLIPQEQWKQVDTLWVLLAVHEFGDVQAGIETLDVSGGLCASARVNGNEAHMCAEKDGALIL
jgi:hypothetical protein